MKRSRCRAFAWISSGVLAFAGALGSAPGAHAQETPMSAARQNQLVRTYCVVCHNQTRTMGGLSLQDFDAARPDPAVAGMMVSKLEGGAMGASGVKPPDWPTVQALIDGLGTGSVHAAAAGGWILKSFNDPATRVPLVTASIRQEGAGAYELTLMCRKSSDLKLTGTEGGPPEMRLAVYTQAGPETGANARAILAAEDGSASFAYEIDGIPGGDGVLRLSQQNSGSLEIEKTLPAQTLTIRNLFPGEEVSFPFGGLTPTVRRVLSTCLAPQ